MSHQRAQERHTFQTVQSESMSSMSRAKRLCLGMLFKCQLCARVCVCSEGGLGATMYVNIDEPHASKTWHASGPGPAFPFKTEGRLQAERSGSCDVTGSRVGPGGRAAV